MGPETRDCWWDPRPETRSLKDGTRVPRPETQLVRETRDLRLGNIKVGPETRDPEIEFSENFLSFL